MEAKQLVFVLKIYLSGKQYFLFNVEINQCLDIINNMISEAKV